MKYLTSLFAAILIALALYGCSTASGNGLVGPTSVQVGGETTIRAQKYSK